MRTTGIWGTTGNEAGDEPKRQTSETKCFLRGGCFSQTLAKHLETPQARRPLFHVFWVLRCVSGREVLNCKTPVIPSFFQNPSLRRAGGAPRNGIGSSGATGIPAGTGSTPH